MKQAILSGISLATVLAAFGAQAQSADVPAADSTSRGADKQTLETMVVTVRKVKEKLNEVPLAITAFSAETLEKAGVKNLEDLSRLTPGLTLNDDGTEYGLTPTIRGQYNLNVSGDPNVAIFLDGIYQSNPSAISLGLINIERIEVVKGPVSALYGRNAFAGAINYVTKKPSDTFAAQVSGTVGDHGQKILQGSVSGAIVPGLLRFGLAVGQDEFDGTTKDDVTGLRAGGHRKKDSQISFDLTPTDKLDISGSYYYGDDYFANPALVYMDNNCGAKSASSIPAGQYTTYCGELNYRQHSPEVADLSRAGSAGNSRQVQAVNLTGKYDLGWADITSLFGYNEVTDQRFADFTGHRDGIPFPLVPGPGYANLHELFGGDANNRDTSVELRLSSKQNQAFRWSGGLYYFQAASAASTLIGVDGSQLPPGQTIGGTGGLFLTSNGQFRTSNLTLVNQTDRLVSEFGSADYDILPNLTAGVELRHSDEGKSQDILRNAFVANTVRPFGPPTSSNFHFDNYRTSLSYKFTPEAIFYLSVADGTKAGGFNSRATIPSEIAYQPETNTTYEIGSKTTLLNGKLQLNAAVFHIKSQDLQISGPSDDPHNTGLVTKNFGGTTNTGFELELSTAPYHGVSFNGGVGYANPKFTSGTYDFSNAATCALIPSCAGRVTVVSSASGNKTVVDLSGLAPPRSSKVNATFGVAATRNINPDLDWFGRIDLRYESRQYSTVDNFNYWGARTNVNVRTGVQGDHYTVTFFVNNLTNNITPEYASANVRLNDFIGPMVAYLPAGRTIGVTATYKY